MTDQPDGRPITRVEIAAGAHQVVVECAAPLNTVARKALELWHATETVHITGGWGTTVGFTAELSPDDGPDPTGPVDTGR